MDLSKIQQYLNYQPCFSDNLDHFMEDILCQAGYLNEQQKKDVRKAYDFACKYHGNTKRLSGEPYMIHPVKVLEFLMFSNPDVTTMQTALLHDVIEDTPATYEDVKYHFGQEVADLCEGLAKVGKVRYKGEDRHLETLKKTFLAMGKDLRVIIVKIADRVHNIQTLHYHPKKEKQIKIAKETLKIYVPIAKRLGLYVYQGYLENGAFKILNPKDFRKIEKYVAKHYGSIDTFKVKGIDLLKQLCKIENIPFIKISGRLKSPYRIWKKLQEKYQTEDVGKIMDIVAFRIVTKSVGDCYNALGVIHKYYTPIFSKMKDYIALPKPNGYRSLHTTILGMFDFPVEIQVRTEEMDHVANFGVAAHFAYSDANASVKVSSKQAQWIQKLQEIVKKYQTITDKEGFKDELNIEILQQNIFVYTPKGDIIELPQGSTVLDFAFRVHTELGLKFRNGFINGKIVPIDYTLKTGDIVDIKTFKNKYTASKSRIHALHTPSAKSKLNRFIREQEKEEIFKNIVKKINEKLQKYNLPLLGSKHDRIKKKRSGGEYETLLFKIRDKQISITKLIKSVYKDIFDDDHIQVGVTGSQKTILLEQKSNTHDEFGIDKTVIVDNDKKMNVILCPHCKPKRGDKIIARSGKDGIKIHSLGCDALRTVHYRKLLEAHWVGEHSTQYSLDIEIMVNDKPGSLLRILKILDFLGIDIRDISIDRSKMQQSHGSVFVSVRLVLCFPNPGKIYFLLKNFAEKKNLLNIVKKKIC